MTNIKHFKSSSIDIFDADMVKEQVGIIQSVMKAVMQKDTHYGIIPGCGDKAALLKPGAEKLCLTFRLASTYRVERVEYKNGHREYIVTCTLTHIPTGAVWGEGLGSCSTLENKFQFRWERIGGEIPKEYWDSRDKSLLGGESYTVRKVDGKWSIYQKIEHDNPADYYNTCLKMGKKRSHVDAILTATSASDIFTQDIDEDMDLTDDIKAEKKTDYDKEPPKKKETKQNGDYEKKAPAEDNKLQEFEEEMITYFDGDQDSIEKWLMDQTKDIKQISTVSQISSQKWLNKLKGDFRKYKEKYPQQRELK